ncbi:MAG: hypothetical protein ABI747_00310 [Candidatus Moraniibacteriota bacterium]
MHTFLLIVEKDHSELTLKQEEEVLGTKNWLESRDMGRQLFTAIAEFLKENSLKSGDIVDFQVKTDVSDNFTSVKIAETVAKVYTWGVKVLSSKN